MSVFRLLMLASSKGLPMASSMAAAAVDAIYTIPAGEELATPVELKFEDARLVHSGSEAKMEFKLPALLKGPEGKIFTLQGAIVKDSLVLKSRDEDAECIQSLAVTNQAIGFITFVDDLEIEISHE